MHDDAAPVRGGGAERNGASGVAPDPRACLFFLCWFGTTTLKASKRAAGVGDADRHAGRHGERMGECDTGALHGGSTPPPAGGGVRGARSVGGLPRGRAFRSAPYAWNKCGRSAFWSLPRDTPADGAPRSPSPASASCALSFFVDRAVGRPRRAVTHRRGRAGTKVPQHGRPRGCPGDPRRVPLPPERPPLARGDTPTRPLHVTHCWSGASQGVHPRQHRHPHTGAAPHGPPDSGSPLLHCPTPAQRLGGDTGRCADGADLAPPRDEGSIPIVQRAMGTTHRDVVGPANMAASPAASRTADPRGTSSGANAETEKKRTARLVFRGASATATDTKMEQPVAPYAAEQQLVRKKKKKQHAK